MNHKGLVVLAVLVVVGVCVRNAGDTRGADTVAIVLKFSLLECVIDEERRERIQDGGGGGEGGLTARRGA